MLARRITLPSKNSLERTQILKDTHLYCFAFDIMIFLAINHTFMIMMYYLFILPRGGGNLKKTWRASMLSQTEPVEIAFIGGTGNL